jgi:hypothetical protein
MVSTIRIIADQKPLAMRAFRCPPHPLMRPLASRTKRRLVSGDGDRIRLKWIGIGTSHTHYSYARKGPELDLKISSPRGPNRALPLRDAPLQG